MSITFNFLPAGGGDAILVSADHKNILIDGGYSKTYYRVIKNKLKEIKDKQQYIDLVVLTHIDDDHINGLLKLLEDEQIRLLIKEMWFNSFNQFTIAPAKSSYETSTKKGITFDELVDRIKKENDFLNFEKHVSIEKFDSPIELFGHLQLTLLSPNESKLQRLYQDYEKYKQEQERNKNLTSGQIDDYHDDVEELANKKFEKDNSPTNGSSIAFILKYKESFKFLLLADAHIDLIVQSLKNLRYSKQKPLKIDFVKLSHHGSKHNLNQDFLDIIDTDTFIISTNGAYKHPNKETLCKIIMNPERDKTKKINLVFNYKDVCDLFEQIFNKDFTQDERNHYNFHLRDIEKKALVFGEDNGFKVR